MRRYRTNTRVFTAIGILLSIVGYASAQQGSNAVDVFRADRGFRPTGSYSLSDIESVNDTSGNVSLQIPLAQTPPGRNGHTFKLSLIYNSALYDLMPQTVSAAYVSGYGSNPPPAPITAVEVSALSPRDSAASGGWKYSYRNYLDLETRPCNASQTYCSRWNLVLADGTSHILRLQAPNDSFNDPQGSGFSQLEFYGYRNGLTGDNTYYGGNRVYYTTDGSFIRVEINSSIILTSPPIISGSWSAYFPDGRIIRGPNIGWPKDADQLCDRNGQCVSIAGTYDSAAGVPVTEITDAMGRRISIGFNDATMEDEIKVLGYGAAIATINPRENSAALTTKVKWKMISFGQSKPEGTSAPWNGIFYHCRPQVWAGDESENHTCTSSYSLKVVDKITLPVAAPNLFYQFQYADSTAPVGQRSRGEIREIVFPNNSAETPAKVIYTWRQKEINANAGGWSPVNWFEAVDNPLESKTLTYLEQDGSSSVQKTQTWNYSFTLTTSEITSPTQQKSKFYFTSKGALGDWRKGLVHKTASIPAGGTEATAETTWRCWAQNEPWLGVNAVDDPRNAFPRVQFNKLGDGSNLMNAILSDQDKNGNTVLQQELDWMPAPTAGSDPGCSPPGAILRQTANRFWNPAGGEMTPAYSQTAVSKQMTNAYWADIAAKTRNSILETRVFSSSPTSPESVTQTTYDDPDGRANPRFQYRWDSTKNAAAPAVPTLGITLTSGNAVYSERQYVNYGDYSLLSQSIDESLNATSVAYGSLTDSGCSAFSNLYPTSVSAPEGQSKSFRYDCATGLLKEEIFTTNNNLKAAYTYDIFGRITEQIEASNESDIAKKRKTTTAYNDLDRTVRVAKDRVAFNDQQVATVYHFNQLGELFLQRDTDDTGGAVSASGSAGVKSIGVSRMQNGGRILVISNPYRATSDETMGWVRKEFDSEGRLKEEAHYRGAAIPWAGGTANLTGKTSYTRSANSSTTIDAAGASSTQTADALGRIKTVAQPGQSGATYTYNLLDNLTKVEQTDTVNYPGEKVDRIFAYSSLGRLISATNPESGLTSYEYFNNGTLKKRTDARLASVTFTVDGLNRVIQKNLAGGAMSPATGHFCYDGKEFQFSAGTGTCVAASRSDYVRGALTSHGMVRDSALVGWTTLKDIDALGRPWRSEQKIEGLTAINTFLYEFNAGGALTKLQYPSGRWLQYGQTGTNRTSQVQKGLTGSEYYVNGMTYSAAGAQTAATIGQIAGSTSYAQTWNYNSRFQLRQMSAGNLLSLRWAYGGSFDPTTFEETGSDNNGNVRAEKVHYVASGTPKTINRNFGYDPLNRIASFSEDTGKNQNFGYDGFGNLWQLGAANGVPAIAQNGPAWYRQEGEPVGSQVKNRLDAVTYDAAGHQEDLSVNGTALKVRYDAEGHQVKVENASVIPPSAVVEYSYDATGQRVKKTFGGVTTYYVYDATGQLMAEYGGTVTTPGTQYLVNDALGSTRLITGQTANCLSRTDYAPFGAEIPRDNAQWPCYGGGTDTTQKFTGKERDAETGLDYFGARYMAAAQGRFTSPDAPFADQHPADPQSWNLYAYVRNNPLRFVDPTGQAIQLTGSTEEDRKKELEAIKASLVNSKVSSSLNVSPEKDKDGKQTGRFFVGIDGDASAFAKAGDLESALAGIIGDNNIVQFGFGEKATLYDESTPNFLRPLTFLSTQTLNVGQRYGGGLTLHGSITMSGFIQSIVDPGNLRDRTAEAEGIPGANLGETVAHELMGHAGAFLRGQMGAPNNQRAVNAENAARARGGPSRGRKRSH